MLIPLNKLANHFKTNITGVLHIGAHECEELQAYLNENISMENIYWVEAMEDKVTLMKKKDPNINIIQAIISDKDNQEVQFHITNNGESSSILEFGTHAQHHSHIKVVCTITGTTTRLDTLIENNNIPIEKLNFMNLDIQGTELKALKSMEKYLTNINYIYTEINTEYVYKKCCLLNELDDFLNKHNFKRVAISMPQNGRLGWGDAFYIKF